MRDQIIGRQMHTSLVHMKWTIRCAPKALQKSTDESKHRRSQEQPNHDDDNDSNNENRNNISIAVSWKSGTKRAVFVCCWLVVVVEFHFSVYFWSMAKTHKTKYTIISVLSVCELRNESNGVKYKEQMFKTSTYRRTQPSTTGHKATIIIIVISK